MLPARKITLACALCSFTHAMLQVWSPHPGHLYFAGCTPHAKHNTSERGRLQARSPASRVAATAGAATWDSESGSTGAGLVESIAKHGSNK